MANSYLDRIFTVDTSTDIDGLTGLKGSAPDHRDQVVIVAAAQLIVNADLVCKSITGVFVIDDAATLTVNPGAGALCSLADVASRAGDAIYKVADQTLGDILAAGDLLREETGLRLSLIETASRGFHVFDSSTLYPKELRRVTAVTDAAGFAVSYTEVMDADGVFVDWIDLASGPMTGRLTIAGEWGWTSIPSLIRTACAMTVVDWYKRDRAVTSTPVGEIGFDTTRRTRALPPYVVDMIRPFRAKRL